MSEALPVTYLARHGETAWSLSGQHTGRTALPLTQRRERKVRALLRGLVFAKVLASRLQRAARTCEFPGQPCSEPRNRAQLDIATRHSAVRLGDEHSSRRFPMSWAEPIGHPVFGRMGIIVIDANI
jgi:broad specificity phosphatase PhoE